MRRRSRKRPARPRRHGRTRGLKGQDALAVGASAQTNEFAAHLRRHRLRSGAGGDVAFRALAGRRRHAGYSAPAARSRRLDASSIAQRVAKAVQRKAFSRGFKAEAKADPESAELVDRLLEDDALRFLSLVNKAGLAMTGAMKVEVGDPRAAASSRSLQASDGAPDGAAKLDRLVRGVLRRASKRKVARINLFTSRQLDLALGRSNVIHAALNAGPASAAFLVKLARLVQYRAGDAPAAKADTHAVDRVCSFSGVCRRERELGRVYWICA